MAKRDYYEILGVEREADEKEIKKAYRRLAMKYHPDRNSDDPKAEDKFKEATEAYEVLSDEEKREAFDRFGHAGVDQQMGGGGGGFSGGGFGDIFGDFFGVGEVAELAAALKGKTYSKEAIAQAIAPFDTEKLFGGVTQQAFLQLIY